MPKRKQAVAVLEPVEPLIREIRGERVILDSDLTRVYGVPTTSWAYPEGRRLIGFHVKEVGESGTKGRTKR